MKLPFLNFFPSSKNDFWPFLKFAKNGIWSTKFFREIDLFDFRSFFGLDFFKFSGSLYVTKLFLVAHKIIIITVLFVYFFQHLIF